MADLIINNWQAGMSDDFLQGFVDMVNLDTASTPGVLQISKALENKSASGVTIQAPIYQIVAQPDDPTRLWAVDGAKVYYSNDSGDTWSLHSTLGGAMGIAIYKNYAFGFAAGTISYCPIASSTWTGWKSVSDNTSWYSGFFHPSLVASDDTLYFGGSNIVGYISEKTGQTFDPTNTATYTYVEQALVLPPKVKVRCFTQNDKYLQIGTYKGTNLGEVPFGNIYHWDRTSVTYDRPTQLTGGVQALITRVNDTYVVPGKSGSIGKLVKPSYTLFKKMPAPFFGLNSFAVQPNAIAFFKDKLLMGAGSNGVVSVDDKGSVVREFTPSTTDAFSIDALLPVSEDSFVLAWHAGAVNGIDKLSTSNYYTDYKASFTTAMYQVGTSLQKKKFSQVEVRLAKPLTSGLGLRLSYRTARNGQFTAFATYDYDGNGGIYNLRQDWTAPCTLPLVSQLQIKCELTCGGSASPELLAIILR